MDAHAEEAQAGLQQDHGGELARADDQDGRHRVGEHVAQDDARVARSQGGRRLDVVELLEGEHVRADGARVEHPATEREHAHQGERIRPHHGHDGDGEHDDGEGELHVRDPHDDGIALRAAPARDEPHHHAHESGNGYRAHGEGERDAAAVEEARKDIAAEIVRAEEMRARPPEPPRRDEPLAEARLERIVDGEGGSEEARHHHEPEEAAPDRHGGVPSHPAAHQRYRIRGSITVYRRSTARLITTNTVAERISTVCTTGKSRKKMASTMSLPMPGHAKIDSVMTAPPRRAPICSPITVSTGMAALRRAWRKITLRSASPLARPVRM